MRAIVCYLIVWFILGQAIPLFGQNKAGGGNAINIEKEKFLQDLKRFSGDSSIIRSMTTSFVSDINSITISINKHFKLSNIEKEKASRSLVYFIKELGTSVRRQKVDIYDIPGAVQSYYMILTALVSRHPLLPLLKPIGARQSQLMAVAFSQYKEYGFLDDVAVYKRVASSPEFILQFLEHKPGFRFADSLLMDAAAHDPFKIVSYLKSERRGVQERIRNSDDIYLRQINILVGDKNASELMPFITQIAENRITTQEIIEKRTDILSYFQLMVNTLQGSLLEGNGDQIFLKPLRSAIRQKSWSFYVHELNELHDSPETRRFASVKGLRPQDLYYIITSSGEDLYTSSYLGLYKRLMEHFKGRNADSLFDIVQYDNLRIFVRLAANYNTLGNFVNSLTPEKRQEIFKRFMGRIEADENTALEKAMDIADSYSAIEQAPEVGELIRAELQSNLNRCKASNHYLGIRLYDILIQVFELVTQKDGLSKLWATLGDYEVLRRNALANSRGEINELVLFYGDEDGVASFGNFLRLFSDTSKWKLTKNEQWVCLRSKAEPIYIYANRPLDIKEELDLRAQDSLMIYFKEQMIEPSILVHRGHSYHLDKTLTKLTPSVKLAILGSCGGYNKTISIATINPDIQVIGSKKTGSMSINDPIIDVINDAVVTKSDIAWPEIWRKLAARFSKDESAMNMFNEYFPPSRNLGLFVLKLFNHYSRMI